MLGQRSRDAAQLMALGMPPEASWRALTWRGERNSSANAQWPLTRPTPERGGAQARGRPL